MVKSPCVKMCQQNKDGLCLGCFRTIKEIEDWYDLSDIDKLKIRQDAIERKNKIKGNTDYYGFPN
jgi:uncharacterized protein